MLKYLLIVIYSLFQVTAYASGPFTQEIGIEKKPEIIEVEIEKEDVVEIILEDETENLIDIIEEKKDEVVVDKEIKETENNQMVTILNIDPVVAYPLKNYKLKGIALSYDSKHKFKRKKIKKFDQAKIPTTHTIQENDTVEKIAFRYGFSLREIEIANAIYPGSRKLVTGDKLVIPNRFHIIKEGQTLSSIADRYKIDPVQLATYNNIRDEDILFIGNKLLLPFFIHVTVEKEDIKFIAGKYEREISELIEFNNFEEKTLKLNKHQLVKIPIYANKNIEYSTLDQKSINDFEIDKKNLAIVEIQSGQYMVREGDKIGDGDGVIVSIENNKMIVLQNNIEFQFFINAPIVGQSIASLPQQIEDSFINEENNMLEEESSSQKSNNNQSNNNEEDLITNIEDLFN